MWHRFVKKWIVLSCMVFSAGWCGHACAQVVDEWKAKAALIYNLILFTEWQVAPTENLGICVLKESALTKELSKFQGRVMRNAALRIIKVSESSGFSQCSVLLMDTDSLKSISNIRKNLEGLSVLTIMDEEDIWHEGVMISISVFRDRIVFDIDLKSAQASRISISSKLLRLARGVIS